MSELNIHEQLFGERVNFLEETFSNHMKKVLNQKEEIIKERLVKAGRADIIKQAKEGHRFIDITSVKDGPCEYFYINNGTPSGKFLVGFEQKHPETSLSENNMSVLCTISFFIIEKEPEYLKIITLPPPL